jgi:hypothetical protein
MSYGSVGFSGFGKGLNLRDKPDAVDPAECIDAMNVFFTERGAIKQRDGYGSFASLPGTPESLEPFYWSGTNQLLAGCGDQLVALSSSGVVLASETGLNTGVWDFARAGAPGTETAFAGNGANPLYIWDGVAWATVADSPPARYITMMPVSQGNRLVACGFDDGASFTIGVDGFPLSSSRVYFSDPLAITDPLTFEGANWIELSPGDGEKIQAVVTWREFTVVFKETRFFVFTGTSLDSVGNPIFDYRTVDAGVGLASPRAVTAHRTGIYFMSREGVYRFTGGEPERLSDNVAPIWIGGSSDFFRGGALNHGTIENCTMGVHQERIYLSYPTTSTNDRTLVYDPATDWWSLYDIAASCLASFRISSNAELVFGIGTEIGRHSSNYSTDAGNAITSRWRSGWFDLDTPDQKAIRETKLWGSGVVDYALGHDFQQDVGAPTEVIFSRETSKWNTQFWNVGKWGQSEVLMPYLRRRAVRGTTFSAYLSNSRPGQSWAVHRQEHAIRNPPSRRVSVTKA